MISRGTVTLKNVSDMSDSGNPPFAFEEEEDAMQKLKNVCEVYHIPVYSVTDQVRDHYNDMECEPITLEIMKGIIMCTVSWPGFVDVDPLDPDLLKLISDDMTLEIMRAMAEFEELRFSKRKQALCVRNLYNKTR